MMLRRREDWRWRAAGAGKPPVGACEGLLTNLRFADVQADRGKGGGSIGSDSRQFPEVADRTVAAASVVVARVRYPVRSKENAKRQHGHETGCLTPQ